jgi:hypothetical protein
MGLSKAGAGSRIALGLAAAVLSFAWTAPAVAFPEPPRERPEEREPPHPDHWTSGQFHVTPAELARLRAEVDAHNAKLAPRAQAQTVSAKAFVASQGRPGGAPVLARQRAQRNERATARAAQKREAAAKSRKLHEQAAGSGPDPCGVNHHSKCPP